MEILSKKDVEIINDLHTEEFESIPVERLQELAKAEKDRRLVVLPCKVGESVYKVTRSYNNIVGEIDKYKMDCVEKIIENISYIGKNIFLTFMEAAQSLNKD